MANTTINKILLSATAAMFLTACGGSDSTPPSAAETASAKIQAYATSNTNPVPTVADYAAVGVTVTNLDAMNALVDAKTKGSEVDDLAELEALVAEIPVALLAPAVANAAAQTYTKDSAITALAFASTGGAIASCDVAPVLPAGLALNGTNCEITGTPTAVTAKDTYTVTAENGTGTDTATVDITVNAAPVIKVSPLKTGQTESLVALDDGELQRGVESNLTRNDTDNTVTDNLTGLVWDDGPDNNSTITYANAEALCADPKRLPTISELLTLVDYSKLGPSIDDAFEYKATTSYWSSENNITIVDIRYGGYVRDTIPSDGMMARCVEGTNPIEHTFTKDGDIVTDANSSLVWSKPSDTTEFLAEAFAYCAGLDTSGDWYLPNVTELNTLVGIDEAKIAHGIYWSSTEAAHIEEGKAPQAWNMSIGDHLSKTENKGNEQFEVICVKDAE